MKNAKSEGDMRQKEDIPFCFLTEMVIDTSIGFPYNKLDCTIIL